MFQIDLKSKKSIYEQVIDGFKELILSGIIQPDEKMTSVRDLSKLLTVNPNTVQKAYRELENQGYIYTVSGVGSFATPISDILPDEKKIDEIKDSLRDNLKNLLYLGLDQTEIEDIVTNMLTDILKNINRNRNVRGEAND